MINRFCIYFGLILVPFGSFSQTSAEVDSITVTFDDKKSNVQFPYALREVITNKDSINNLLELFQEIQGRKKESNDTLDSIYGQLHYSVYSSGKEFLNCQIDLDNRKIKINEVTIQLKSRDLKKLSNSISYESVKKLIIEPPRKRKKRREKNPRR